MKRFYKLADCFLLTLRGGDFIRMTLPAKAQGYLSAGKPILAAADGAAAGMIRESGCGESVPAGDAAGLAAAMERVIAAPAGYRGKGETAAVSLNSITPEIFMESLHRLLRQAKKTAGAAEKINTGRRRALLAFVRDRRVQRFCWLY